MARLDIAERQRQQPDLIGLATGVRGWRGGAAIASKSASSSAPMKENCSNSGWPGGRPRKISVMVSAIRRPMAVEVVEEAGPLEGLAEAAGSRRGCAPSARARSARRTGGSRRSSPDRCSGPDRRARRDPPSRCAWNVSRSRARASTIRSASSGCARDRPCPTGRSDRCRPACRPAQEVEQDAVELVLVCARRRARNRSSGRRCSRPGCRSAAPRRCAAPARCSSSLGLRDRPVPQAVDQVVADAAREQDRIDARIGQAAPGDRRRAAATRSRPPIADRRR